MQSRQRQGLWVLMILLVLMPIPATATSIWLPNPGFEEGFIDPWGTGQYAAGKTTWWNSGGCRSSATIDDRERHRGKKSLHIVNQSPRAPHVFGTTQQPFPLLPGVTYRISLWARAKNLASTGGVSIVVDSDWQVRPIQLPGGSYGWTRFEGTFSLPDGNAQIRILSEDVGEVWIDDLNVSDASEEDFSDEAFTEFSDDEPGNITQAVAQFRALALKDYRSAVRKYATDAVVDKFSELDNYIWPETDPRIGWSFFMNVSVVSASGKDRSKPTVAFYHPWSDVYLLTQWEVESWDTRLAAVEIVMGDVLRSRGKFPRKPIPLWRQPEEMFPPLALTTSVVESILDFEALSDGSQSDEWWRAAIPCLDEAELREFNYLGVAELLLDSLGRIDQMRVPSDHDLPQLVSLRSETKRAVSWAAAGRTDELLKTAEQTLPETRQVLRDTPPGAFHDLTIASVVVGDRQSVVFLTPVNHSGYCLSLMMNGDGRSQRITRIDVIVFEAAYRKLAARSQ